MKLVYEYDGLNPAPWCRIRITTLVSIMVATIEIENASIVGESGELSILSPPKFCVILLSTLERRCPVQKMNFRLL